MRKSILIVFISSLATLHLSGQEIGGQKLELERNYRAQLPESTKRGVTPILPPIDTSARQQDYAVPPQVANVSYAPPQLKPLGLKSAPKEKVYNGHLKVGGGVPSAIVGNLGYSYTADAFQATLWAQHLQASSQALENQAFQRSQGRLSTIFGINDGHALETQIGYDRNRVHFYGYDHEQARFEAERIRQQFQTIDVSTRLYNKERTDADLNYFVRPAYYNLKDSYGNTENGLQLELGGDKWFAEKHVFRMVINTDFTTFQDIEKQHLNNIYLQPSFTFHTDVLKLKIGGNFVSNRDIFHLYPDAELSVSVAGDGIQLFALANGDLRKNTFRSLSTYNPFLEIRSGVSPLRNTDYRNYAAGVRGAASWISYSLQGGFAQANNLALFQTRFTEIDNQSLTRFEVVFDTVKMVQFQGSLKLTPIKNLVISGLLSQRFFTPTNQEKAWGIPGLEGTFSGEYRVLDGKAGVKASCFIADKISRLDAIGVAGADGVLVDFNVGGNFRLGKYVGVFLDINNLFNNQRERWHMYPIFGTNILAGITARF